MHMRMRMRMHMHMHMHMHMLRVTHVWDGAEVLVTLLPRKGASSPGQGAEGKGGRVRRL